MRRRDRPMEPEVLHGLRELDAALAGEPGAEPELALLVADVRSAKPEPDSAFLARLDAQVHAGFPRDAAPAPERSRRRRRLLLAPGLAGVAAAAIVALVLAGGGAKEDGAVTGSPGPSGPGARIERAGSAWSSASAAARPRKAAPAAPSAGGDSSASTSPPRRVERSA